MPGCRFFWHPLIVALSINLLACETPSAYRPEVDEFKKATEETSSYMTARVDEASDVRGTLRRELLQDRMPMVGRADGCNDAISAFNDEIAKNPPAPLPQELVDECQLIPDDPDLVDLFNSRPPMRNSARFATAVASYAAALDRVAVSGDQAGFEQAVKDLGDASISLAKNAAIAADHMPPTLPELGLLTSFVAKATFYFLENKRSEALKEAALNAQPWIELGSEGVVRVLYAARFESIRAANDNLFKRLDDVNEASAAQYVAKADDAIVAHNALLTQLSGDPGAPFRKLPPAHQALIDAFNDPGRHLDYAIAAAKDLLDSARAAKAALMDE